MSTGVKAYGCISTGAPYHGKRSLDGLGPRILRWIQLLEMCKKNLMTWFSDPNRKLSDEIMDALHMRDATEIAKLINNDEVMNFVFQKQQKSKAYKEDTFVASVVEDDIKKRHAVIKKLTIKGLEKAVQKHRQFFVRVTPVDEMKDGYYQCKVEIYSRPLV